MREGIGLNAAARLEQDTQDRLDPLIAWIVSMGGLRPDQVAEETFPVLERVWLLDGLIRDDGLTFESLTQQYAIIQEDDELTRSGFYEHFIFALESSYPAHTFQDLEGLLERIRGLGGLREEALPSLESLRRRARQIPGLVSPRGVSLETLLNHLLEEELPAVYSLQELERWLRVALALYVKPPGDAGLWVLPPLVGRLIGWGGVRASELRTDHERVLERALLIPGLVRSDGLSFTELARKYRHEFRVSMTGRDMQMQLVSALDELFPVEFLETGEALLEALLQMGGLHPSAFSQRPALEQKARELPGLVQAKGRLLSEVLADLNGYSPRRYRLEELERWLWVALVQHTPGR
ncbi:MAG: hypothetical protein ACKO6N_21185 [Myxococcota bacterium]